MLYSVAMKPYWKKFALFGLACLMIFAWNLPCWQYCTGHMMRSWSDGTGLIHSYRQTHIWRDFPGWFLGRLLQHDATLQAIRPFSQLLFHMQVWLGLNFGWTATAVTTLLLFAGCLTAAGLLTYRWTQSWLLACASVLLASRVDFALPLNPLPYRSWIAWFPVSDNLLCLLFMLLCLLAFDAWLRAENRRYLLLTWAAFFVAVFSKEAAYVLPPMLFLIAWAVKPHHWLRRVWPHILTMTAAIVGLMAYRKFGLPNPYNPPTDYAAVLHSILQSNPIAMALLGVSNGEQPLGDFLNWMLFSGASIIVPLLNLALIPAGLLACLYLWRQGQRLPVLRRLRPAAFSILCNPCKPPMTNSLRGGRGAARSAAPDSPDDSLP